MEAKQQEWALLPSLWIGKIKSYLQVNKYLQPEKTEELLKAWTKMSFKGKVQEIKAWLKSQGILSEDQKKDNSAPEASQASKRKITPQQVPKKKKKDPKSNHKKKKKAKPRWNKAYPQNYRSPKRQKLEMDDVFNMERTFMELKKRMRKE
ncbi:hypothetical protein O181_119172 [Austropuccinia psidii MF-1]|uniref:Uncharacterized protein n=1 Tax=Austropuccinia psidii MF-1 TaxID=1389203 RepID=A0A9Q3Q145_9BASI|nr:hypothetical protein [Austropuccinia psidii MF-1]